jgi:hypothetical protein
LRRTAVLAFVLFAAPSLARADQVSPSDRVHSRLAVHEAAASNADVRGYLLPGDRVPLVETKGPWRQIVFQGQAGFVASSYSRVVPDQVAPDSSIRLGSWNLKKLGHGAKDFAAVAHVIDDNFDVLAVVEVMQKGGAHAGYDELLTTLGPGWSGQLTARPRPNTDSSNSEFYAVLFRNQSVRPCAGWTELRYQPDGDGSATSTGSDVFVREPAFGCFQFGPAQTPSADFLLAAFHATFKGGTAIDAEVGRLGEVFQTMQEARPGEKDLFIVGDFNRTPPKIAELLPSVADRTRGVGSTLNFTGALTANLYDHVLVFDEQASQEMQGEARVIDVRDVVSDHATFYRTVSDHLPIVVQLRASADDD